MDWTAKIHFGGKLRGVRVEGSQKPSGTRLLAAQCGEERDCIQRNDAGFITDVLRPGEVERRCDRIRGELSIAQLR